MDTPTLRMTLKDSPVTGLWLLSLFCEELEMGLALMEWEKSTGEVDWIFTHQRYRRKGHASRLWHEANRLAEEGKCSFPRHSTDRNAQGHAWVTAVGGACVRGNVKISNIK